MKICAEYDTVAKTLNVTKDGQPMDNVHGVRFEKRYDNPKQYMAEVHMHQADNDHDTHTSTRVRASELEGVKVVPVASQLERAVLDYFKRD